VINRWQWTCYINFTFCPSFSRYCHSFGPNQEKSPTHVILCWSIARLLQEVFFTIAVCCQNPLYLILKHFDTLNKCIHQILSLFSVLKIICRLFDEHCIKLQPLSFFIVQLSLWLVCQWHFVWTESWILLGQWSVGWIYSGGHETGEIKQEGESSC